jgi:protochlorophyllide reductase
MSTVKYAVVTGASPSSIGFLAAKKLAGDPHNFKVILACRSSAKGQAAQEAILEEYPDGQAVFLPLDLASRASIREFVKQLRALDDGAVEKQGLSLLVNNAGVGWGKDTPFIKTEDGLEEIVGVNHFGTFYLTYLLLDDMKRATGEARIVVVTSSLHDPNASSRSDEKKLHLPDFPSGLLQTEEGYDGAKAYRVSKLCNIWFTYELQRRLKAESSSIKVNTVSPGFIPTTGLIRRSGWLGTFFLRYVLDPWRHFGMGITRSPEEGAEVIVQTSFSVLAAEGGKYFNLPKGSEQIEAIESSDESYDEAKAKELWEISMKECEP